ncbi:MAG: methyl-accepting chemotaxis protein [Syntrophobacteraceae bacterium]
MFKNMRLSFKIAAGFGVILLLATALGSLALYNMKNVESLSIKLAKEYVPEVAVANNVERYSLETMFEMRGYALDQDKRYLEAGRKNLAQVKNYIEEAKQLAARSPDLVKLKEGIALAEAKANDYEQLANQTVAKNEDLAKLRATMNESAELFMKSAGEYLKSQSEAMVQEIQSSSESAKLLDRQFKLSLINDIIDLGNWTRIANFKFQALSDPKLMDEANKYFPEIEKKLEKLNAVTFQEHNKKQIASIGVAAAGYKKAMQQFFADWQTVQELGKNRATTGIQVVQIAKSTALAGMGHANDVAATAAASLSSAALIMSIGLCAILVLGVGAGFIIVRNITKPIARVVEGLTEGADQVAAASGQVSSSSQQLAEGASEQAASIEETSSSLEEMSSMTRQNAENANKANHLMNSTKATVSRAGLSMEQLTASMEEISRASEETSKIIKTIDEIAFQTNLLALNAAVEAARAGEAGAGFAVVADEVRNLALRAAEAAKNTANLIEGTVKKIKEGSELVVKTEQEFREVAVSVGKSGELVGEISAASVEQAQGIEQVNKAVGEMDRVVQQNAANAEESASASEEMNSQAEQMKNFVGALKSLVEGSNGNGAAKSDNTGNKKSRAANKYALPESHVSPTAKTTVRGRVNNGSLKTKFTKPEGFIAFDEKEARSADF